MTWSEATPPFPEMAALCDHIVPHPSSSARCRWRPARSTRPLPAPRGSWQPNTNGRSSHTPAWAQPAPSSTREPTAPPCGPARRSRTLRATGSPAYSACPPEEVHGIWVPGPGSYGRNDAGDAGIDAALLSKAVGRPVRVQGMRYEGHGWDPKGPASIHRARAALVRWSAISSSKGFSRVDIDSNESDPVLQPRRPVDGPAAKIIARLWRTRRIPTASPTSTWPGRRSHPCSAQRSGAVVAIVAGVEIDRRSGKIWARKFTVAHDCGPIINPDGFPGSRLIWEALLMRGPAAHTGSSKRGVRARGPR